jgi:DNA-binding MarR family transcriptional regulator
MKSKRKVAPTLTSANSTQPADPPLLSVPRLHVVRRMRRAFLSICRCGDTLFSPYGVTTDQYALIRAVQREPGIRQADLGAVIFAEPNTVTAMVTLLEKHGILRRRPSLTDRRAKLVHLTAKGEMVMQRLSNDWLPMRQILIECFSASGGQEALAILDQVYEKMRVERDRLMAPSQKIEAQLFNTPLRKKKRRLSSQLGNED